MGQSKGDQGLYSSNSREPYGSDGQFFSAPSFHTRFFLCAKSVDFLKYYFQPVMVFGDSKVDKVAYYS